jgi:LmbE family N-acetylglucosaminyl deacetylase
MESTVLKNTNASRRLLVAFAHPDDESFGPSGTIVHYAQQGVAVHYACATRGEAGHVDPKLLAGYDSLAELRTKELLCAAGHLGLAALHLLDYRDSGMENSPENLNPESLMQAPLHEVADKLTLLIREIQPQVVLTHDPTGGYFHPDHIKVHQAAQLAFQWAGDAAWTSAILAPGPPPFQPQKLYYTAFPRRLLKLMTAIATLAGRDLEAFGHNNDINLKRIADVDQAVTTKIRVSRYWEARRLAADCHASQTRGSGGIAASLLQRLIRFDTFTRAVPFFGSRRLERDLYTGIE